MIMRERVAQRLLVDDLAARDVDEHGARLHQRKAVLVEETGRLRRPMAADHHEIALRQEPVELRRATYLAESRWRGRIRLRVAAGPDHPHAQRSAEPADIEPDAAGADDARRLAFHE